MPSYRGANGRYLSAEDVAAGLAVQRIDVVDGQRVVTDLTLPPEEPEEITPEEPSSQPIVGIEVIPSDYGFAIRGIDGMLPMDILGAMDFPEDVSEFRVFFDVDKDNNYKNGLASTRPLQGSEWPPSLDMFKGNTTPNGIRFIAFS